MEPSPPEVVSHWLDVELTTLALRLEAAAELQARGELGAAMA